MQTTLAPNTEQTDTLGFHNLEIDGVYPLGMRIQPITRGRRKKDFQCYEVLLLINQQAELPNYLSKLYQDNNKSFELFEYMFKQAVGYFSTREGNFSINVTPENILHSRFQKLLKSIENFPAERILLEVLEESTKSQEDRDFMIEGLKEAKDKGYRIAMDDYGSSNSNLERFKIFVNQKVLDIVKIDGDFFQQVLKEIEDNDSKKIYFKELQDIMKIAFKNKIKVIIEKIEDDEWVGIAYDIAIEVGEEIGKTNQAIEEFMGFQGYALQKPTAVVCEHGEKTEKSPPVYRGIKS